MTGLEDWKRGLPELEFQQEGDTWVLRRAYPPGTLLGFNVLMDLCEEGDAWGQRRPDRFRLVQEAASHTLPVVSWQGHGNTPHPSTLTGNSETFNVHSPERNNTFTMTVWMPPQYTQAREKFPVLYLYQ